MLEGTVLIESVWLTGRDEEWFCRGWESVGSPPGIEVFCEAPISTMRERYLARDRHAVHDDRRRIAEWDAAAAMAAPLTGFPVLRVDTAAPVDVPELATRIRTALT